MSDVCEAMNYFKEYSCLNIFADCGYFPRVNFYPDKGLQQDPAAQ